MGVSNEENLESIFTDMVMLLLILTVSEEALLTICKSHCFSYSQMLFQTSSTDPLTWNAKSRCQTTPTIVKSIYASEQRCPNAKEFSIL
jgi:hypothetical protein